MSLQLCTLFTSHYAGMVLYNLFYVIFMSSVFGTSFLTCLLAIIRVIVFISPLYLVNWRLVKGSIVVFGLLTIILQSMLTYCQYTFNVVSESVLDDIQFVILASLFVIVVVSNIVAMGKLFQSRSLTDTWRTKRRATVTVGQLSLLYCLCNIGYIIIDIPNISVYENIPIQLIRTCRYILLPLNSACNPAVYLIRTAEMRLYLKNLWVKLNSTCSRMFDEGAAAQRSVENETYVMTSIQECK